MIKPHFTNHLNEDDPTTEDYFKISKSGISQQPLMGSYKNYILRLRLPNHVLQILKMKMTSGVKMTSEHVECDL